MCFRPLHALHPKIVSSNGINESKRRIRNDNHTRTSTGLGRTCQNNTTELPIAPVKRSTDI